MQSEAYEIWVGKIDLNQALHRVPDSNFYKLKLLEDLLIKKLYTLNILYVLLDIVFIFMSTIEINSKNLHHFLII